MISVMISSTSPLSFGVILLVYILFNLGLIHAENSLCWPHKLIPYAITPGFSPYQREYIKEQIDKLNKKTCLHWSDMDETESLQNETSFVRFEKDPSGQCQTQQFLSGGGDDIRVVITFADHCFEGKFVLHEIIHALGFNHEQQRVDRDCYVWVSEDTKMSSSNNIDTFYTIPNIDKFPYDKQSIMHYRRSSDLKALSERFYQWEPLGNDGERLTDMDLWKIQYRFCGRPHYCEVCPKHCRHMEKMEAEMNCNVNTTSR